MGTPAVDNFFSLQFIVITISSFFAADFSLSWDEQMKVIEQFSNENVLLLSLIVFGTCLVILLPIWLKQRRYLLTVKKSAGVKTIVTGLIFDLGVTFAMDLLSEPITDVMKNIIPDGGYGTVSAAKLSGDSVLLRIVTVVIVGPIAEEVIFRGLFLNRLMSKMPVWGAVVISGLIFGIYHMNSVQSIIATFMGIAIAILYVKTKSLAVCMVFHIINNGLATLMEHFAANAGSNIDMIIIYPSG